MPARIVVVGLGPGDPSLRTLAAQRALDAATRIVLRTRIHPGLDDLAADPRVTDCDDLYDRAATFDAVYEAVAARVCDFAEETVDGTVVFAVPGHPRFGERSVPLLEARSAERGLPIDVQGAVSALDAVASSLGTDPLQDQVQLLDALALAAAVEHDPFGGGLLGIDPHRPCLIGQVYAPSVAAAVKLALARLYPEDHPLTLVRAAGVPDEECLTSCALFELDRQAVDHLTSVWVAPLPALAAFRSPWTLARIFARLRAPAGCPWDRQQTHATLRAALIEEAYEAADAIDAADPENLAEELGDLLGQVALHAQIAEEAGTFTLEDVYEQVDRKLVRRHPHVFADADARTPAEVVTTWEGVKATERAAAGKADRSGHPLDRLPRSMPALTRAAALLGPRKGSPASEAGPGATAAAGDALLAAVEVAIGLGVDPEAALDAALRRRVAAELAETHGKVPS